MPSATYELFRQAMAARKQILCTYRGRRRELCPVILGHTGGEEKALTFQFAGESNSRLPPGGEWRCLSLGMVSDVTLRDGPWHTGSGHAAPQACVDVVEFDVNPDSPYFPAQRL
ncbi:MAG: hypothetical protein JWQ89_2198 [Devosia sp.]|uniref:hypothetical protein n=1 Tax=Devosia sp. TaxID=1871048 RepID=UPI002602AC93|nr:hypothetical protein [Devosia sp.]MDB5540471.1 hypothetical protein [Devosia sp.]